MPSAQQNLRWDLTVTSKEQHSSAAPYSVCVVSCAQYIPVLCMRKLAQILESTTLDPLIRLNYNYG